jgi:hypothetical protein
VVEGRHRHALTRRCIARAALGRRGAPGAQMAM